MATSARLIIGAWHGAQRRCGIKYLLASPLRGIISAAALRSSEISGNCAASKQHSCIAPVPAAASLIIAAPALASCASCITTRKNIAESIIKHEKREENRGMTRNIVAGSTASKAAASSALSSKSGSHQRISGGICSIWHQYGVKRKQQRQLARRKATSALKKSIEMRAKQNK